MQVGVGFSDYPNSVDAGKQAARMGIEKANRSDNCDIVLLFNTASHDQNILRKAVAEVVGASARIIGGGAAGIITNEAFGYAGDQVGAACIWLEGSECNVIGDDGILEGEEETGIRLGKELARQGITKETAMMLFYDAVEKKDDQMRLMMATWLLKGMEEGLGFLPGFTGAGLQGDLVCTPTAQYTEDGLQDNYTTVLTFSDDIQIDNVIMHGCRPASQYYTVTKSDGPVILEIEGVPAIDFIDNLIGPSIRPEQYPFFLLFGINHGKRWEEYKEENYASRLCQGLDMERRGLVMFEPDMVAGTEFQLMFRSLDLDYMRPKIESLFEKLDGREPVFGMYIDCAGRCAGYGGVDIEDAVVLQETVAGRVPLLGLYTGVEIAPLGGKPRGLDWTGVFCLFSKKGKEESGEQKERVKAEEVVWEAQNTSEEEDKISLETVNKLVEQNIAKVFQLDTQSIQIRHELEQKRRGFALLAELSVILRNAVGYQGIFEPVAQRINAALNMQKTVVLTPAEKEGGYTPTVMQGFSLAEKSRLSCEVIDIEPEMLDVEHAVLVTVGDPKERLANIREMLDLTYFISIPLVVQKEIVAILVTGRKVEQPPYLSRLGETDVETVQAISSLLESIMTHHRLEKVEERTQIMVDEMPMCCVFWDENANQIDCNQEALHMFGASSKEEFHEEFYRMSPEYQPDGRLSEKTAKEIVLATFVSGTSKFEWMHKTLDGRLLPVEVSLVRVPHGEYYTVVGYMRDLSEQKEAMEELEKAQQMAEDNSRMKSEFLAAVSHEIRTPLNAVESMAQAISKMKVSDEMRKKVEQGVKSAHLLSTTIDGILDYTRFDSQQVEIREASFGPRKLIDNVVKILKEEADEKDLKLSVEVSNNLPEALIGDADKLQQILFGLTSNAIKFTEKGEVTICARAKKYREKVELCIAVKDMGLGISEENQQKIFLPLTVVEGGYTRKQGGLGMGLAIAQSLSRMMKGEITCESELGKGSTFSIIVMLEEPKAVEEKATAQKDYSGLAGLKVLVAEDNMINQMIMTELLGNIEIIPVIANNGVEALKRLEEQKFDIVLMDIQMPEMDGLTAASKIRMNTEYKDMPILAMTANSAKEHREESRRSGMNEHLTKPIDVNELYEALDKWVRK